jgi:hypothetical protein
MQSNLSNRGVKLAALALILVHLVISIVHGRAHQGATVALTTFGYVYVVIVITVAPLVAGALLFSRKQKVGALLLALSMLGSLAFGVWYHFLSAGSDNIAEVPGGWHSTFLWTAIALALLEFIGVIFGFLIYRASAKAR